MKLVVSRRATRRLHEIADYLHERNPAAARRVQQCIRDAFDLLVEYPQAGRALDLSIRRLVVPRVPYVIYYRIDEGSAVVIITVRHAAQREPR